MALHCAACQMPLPGWELTVSDAAACTNCGAKNTVRVFPALFRDAAGPVRPESALDGDAVCFDHAGKRAVASCNQCGRFVCQLCSVEFSGQVWCPACVAAGKGETRVANPDSGRLLYDSIALAAPFASLLVWPITAITAPGTLVFALINWKKPLSLVRRSRWRMVVAILISAIGTVAWVWLLFYGLARLSTSRG